MIHAEALPRLVNILATSAASSKDPAAIAATHRTLSKAAIATARLCLDPSTADSVVRLGGLDRLVELARGAEGEADTVKIAALAAVKTVTIYCSASLNIDLDAAEHGNTAEMIKGGCGEYYTTETPISSLESFV